MSVEPRKSGDEWRDRSSSLFASQAAGVISDTDVWPPCLVPLSSPSRSCSDRVPVAVRRRTAGKPGSSARVEGVLIEGNETVVVGGCLFSLSILHRCSPEELL